jgi:hypothetical protein
MFVIQFARRIGAIVAASCVLSIMPHAVHAYTADQQQACMGDAFRLCSSEIPDIDRVKACMIRNRSQLSPECRAYVRPGPEPEPVAADEAVEPRPVTRKTRKPHHIRRSRPSAT